MNDRPVFVPIPMENLDMAWINPAQIRAVMPHDARRDKCVLVAANGDMLIAAVDENKAVSLLQHHTGTKYLPPGV